MIELFIVACVVGGTACRDVSLVYDANELTPMQCTVTAQQEGAKWIVTHPGWRMARFGCRASGRYSKA